MNLYRKESRQRGVTLVFALLALVALTLGSVALIRAVDTGVLALGNLAFKQSGLMAGGRAAEQALTWLAGEVNGSNLYKDIGGDTGYYATSIDTLDATGATVGTANVQAQVDWDSNGCKVYGVPVGVVCIQPSRVIEVGADKVRYVITRMCSAEGPIVMGDGQCARPPIPDVVAGNSKGLSNQAYEPDVPTDEAPATMYRVITRTLGPKGTVTFTETMAHF